MSSERALCLRDGSHITVGRYPRGFRRRSVMGRDAVLLVQHGPLVLDETGALVTFCLRLQSSRPRPLLFLRL